MVSLIKKEIQEFLILTIVIILLSFITYGLTGEQGLEAKPTDVTKIEQMQGATTTPEGVIDVTKSPGTNRILSPTDTSISPLKTKLGTISNAKLENYVFDFGDIVQGKMTSFTDNNLISIKSMFDPDTRIEITMIKDGWAKVEQYDKYGNLINSGIA